LVADELERPGNDVEHHDAEPHLPSPTIWPFGFAAGVTLVLVGLIVSWPVTAVGAVLSVIFGFLWIRQATQEVRGAPPPEAAAAPPAAVEEEAEVVERYPRSKFLEGATLGIGGLIGAIVTLPAIGFTVLPAFLKQGYDEVDLGPLENFPEGQWLVATFLFEKGGEDVHRRTAFVRNNGLANDVPSFTIISNRCVHLGCPVRPQGLTEEPKEVETDSGPVALAATAPSGFGCPCHGGAYDTEGNRTAGPPVRALDRYRYAIKEGRLFLAEPYSVSDVDGQGAEAEVRAYDLADPGQHVDGVQQFFYPPKFWIR
jgi:menaquinol-cytochrome c reductase iron-sulfur subunit